MMSLKFSALNHKTKMPYYFKGNFTDSLSIDVSNLALIRGYCAFEYLRTYNKIPFCLKAHLLRFLYSIKQMGLEIDYTLEELEAITYQLIEKENKECGIKWYATGGSSLDGLRHGKKGDVFAFSIPMVAPHNDLYKTGIKTQTYRIQRPLPEAKTTAYFQACHILSQKTDLHEIIYINEHNKLLEASTSNLFIIKGNTIYTADKDVLHGITRQVVLDLIKDKYPLIYEQMPYDSLSECSEAFITATNKEILPVAQIDNYYFNIGPVTASICQLFAQTTKYPQLQTFIPPLYQNELLLKS